ncbi:MAG: DedA family protein [Patescibacteria group bacterium]
MLDFLDPATIIKTLGLLGVFAIVFAESGLFFGFFFPGDSLLFTAGLLASQGYFSIVWLSIGCFICAVAGDSVGYAFGKKVGPKIFTREDSLFFHKKHVARAEQFYTTYGTKAIILARFVPIVRTFVPIVAGVGSMDYKKFITSNIVGGALWAVTLPLLGFWLGTSIPSADQFLWPIIATVIVLSFLPIVWEYLKAKTTDN